MAYVLNSDNYCYSLSSVVLLDDVTFVYCELKQRLIEVWCRLEQSTVDVAVDQWRRRFRTCVHVEDTLNIAF